MVSLIYHGLDGCVGNPNLGIFVNVTDNVTTNVDLDFSGFVAGRTDNMLTYVAGIRDAEQVLRGFIQVKIERIYFVVFIHYGVADLSVFI